MRYFIFIGSVIATNLTSNEDLTKDSNHSNTSLNNSVEIPDLKSENPSFDKNKDFDEIKNENLLQPQEEQSKTQNTDNQSILGPINNDYASLKINNLSDEYYHCILHRNRLRNEYNKNIKKDKNNLRNIN